jgi:hypothetical protein
MKLGRIIGKTIILGFFLLAGCPAGEDSEPEKIRTQQDKVTPPSQARVEILPASPTIQDDLRIETSAAQIESCRWLRNEEMVDTGQVVCLPQGHFVKGDVITVIIVADGNEAKASTIVRNSPPKVTGVAFSPKEFHQGIDLTAVIQGDDPDGDEISYRITWIVNGEERSWESGTILFGDLFGRGDRLEVKVVPFDGEADGMVFLSGEVVVPNGPPRNVSTPPAHFQAEEFVYDVVAADPEGDELCFSLEQAPLGMRIDTLTGRIHWLISGAEGEHPVRISVKDAAGGYSVQEFNLSILASL